MYYNVGDIMNDEIISVRIMPEGYGKASKEVRDYILSLHDEIVELQQELERLNNIIKETTEYIESFEYYIPEDNKEELIKILKGEENE